MSEDDLTAAYMSGLYDGKKAAQLQQREPVANYCKECLTYNGHQEGCSHYVESQAEQQKPVAFRLYKNGELYALKHEKDDRGLHYTWEPLYTSPPANANAGKPWVGLTDEEIYALTFDGRPVKFARAVEAKLKEKNT